MDQNQRDLESHADPTSLQTSSRQLTRQAWSWICVPFLQHLGMLLMINGGWATVGVSFQTWDRASVSSWRCFGWMQFWGMSWRVKNISPIRHPGPADMPSQTVIDPPHNKSLWRMLQDAEHSQPAWCEAALIYEGNRPSVGESSSCLCQMPVGLQSSE